MSNIVMDSHAVRQHIEHLKRSHPELQDDIQLLADTCEGETELHSVLTRLVREQRDAGAFADAIKAQEKDLATRRGRFEFRQQIFRDIILLLMETAQQRKLVLPEATLSITNVAPKPIVDDESVLPDELCNFNRWPNMVAIKAAVKTGAAVPGVHMSNGGTTLTIRVK